MSSFSDNSRFKLFYSCVFSRSYNIDTLRRKTGSSLAQNDLPKPELASAGANQLIRLLPLSNPRASYSPFFRLMLMPNAKERAKKLYDT